MVGVAKMLHVSLPNSEPYPNISTTMPTEREHSHHNPEPDGYGQHNPEIKIDTSKFRPVWLQKLAFKARHNYFTAWFTVSNCWVCFSIRMSMTILAIVGLHSLIT